MFVCQQHESARGASHIDDRCLLSRIVRQSPSAHCHDRVCPHQVAERVQIIRNVGANDDVEGALWLRPCLRP